jgi:hypothetical protein
MMANLQKATGIPPHVVQLAVMEHIKGMVDKPVPNLVDAFAQKTRQPTSEWHTLGSMAQSSP